MISGCGAAGGRELNLESGMSTAEHDDCSSHERLSALADGETGGSASTAACAFWHAEEAARRDWHAWQLIGDVLRSDELASSAARDARFLAGVRARLAVEAVVLAPALLASVAPAAARRSRWLVPASMAAGFVLVVGAFVVVRPDQSASDPAPIALADSAAIVAAPVAPAVLVPADLREPVRASEAVIADRKVIRDARLERYLAAHKQFSGTTALGVPSAFLRSATVESASR